MAVAIENTGTSSVSSAGGAASGSLSLTVTAANALVVVICTQGANTTTPAVTWDSGGTNQSMTLIGSINNVSFIYGLLAPTTGTKTLAWSWTTNTDYAMAVAGLTGVTQTSLSAAFANFTSATATSASASVTVTTASGNLVIGGSTNADTSTATGINGTTLQNVNNVANGGTEVINYILPSGSSQALSYTLSSSVSWWYAGVNVVAAGAGGAVSPFTMGFAASEW